MKGWSDFLAGFDPPWRPPMMRCQIVPVCPPSVAAEQDWPRLRVWRFGGYSPDVRSWCWQVDDPGGWVIDAGHCATQPEALAVGLAALETASVRMSP